TAADVRTSLSLSAVPQGGSGAYVYVVGRRVALNQEYAARVRVLPDGSVGVAAVRFAGSSNESVLGSIVTLPGFTYTAGTELEVRVQVTGTAPTNLAVTVWPAGTPEPAEPTVTATDDTPALQEAGALGLAAYLSGSATAPVDVRFTGLDAVVPAPATDPGPGTQDPGTEDPGTEEPPPADGTIAADAFDRTVAGGLGTADVGGAWSVRAGGSRQSVSAGTATLRVGPGNNTGSNLAGVSQTAADVRTSLSLSAVPQGGSGAYVYVVGRRVALNQEYAARVRVLPDGSVGVAAVRFAGSSNESVLGSIVTLPGFTYTAGTELEVRVQVTGTAPTNLAVTVWPAGTPEPAEPTVTATDDTPALQEAGALGLAAYLSGSATAPVDVRFTGYAVRSAP
ncbi:radical SAM protein, partial [Blastococcus sp. SYSU DS0617]